MQDGETLLHLALSYGHLKVFILLLGSLTDMDVNAKDKVLEWNVKQYVIHMVSIKSTSLIAYVLNEVIGKWQKFQNKQAAFCVLFSRLHAQRLVRMTVAPPAS